METLTLDSPRCAQQGLGTELLGFNVEGFQEHDSFYFVDVIFLVSFPVAPRESDMSDSLA